MEKISIVIPAHNEEKRIKSTLEAYSEFYKNIKKEKKADYEIIVVINNTNDKTEEIVKEIQKKNKKIEYLNFKRGGKGFAVIEGFKDALKRDNSLIGFVDADMATPPEQYWRLVINIKDYDGAIADRYIRGSKVFPPVTFRRAVVGRTFNLLTRSVFFLPYKDTQCGAKLFRRETLEEILPYLGMSQWAFDVDLLYNMHKKGFKITPIPTVWVDKEYSKINFLKAGPWMALALVRLRILNSPIKKFVRIYDKSTIFLRKALNKKNI